MKFSPSDIKSGRFISSEIERVEGPYPASNFILVNKNDNFPVRFNKLYWVIIDKEKTETFVDKYWNILIPKTESISTYYGRYIKAKNGVSREHYLKPHQITLTKVMKKKQSITRYFAQYKLDTSDKIFEISKSSFGLNTSFYKTVSIEWELNGSKENILLKNNKAIEEADKTLNGIINYVDPLEFYEGPKLTPEEELQKKLSNLK